MGTDCKKLLSALGLCRRAGKGVFGTDAVCEGLREGKVKLVATPTDNSANTQKKLSDKCNYYQIPLLSVPVSGEALAKALGRTGHTAAMGVTDENFVTLIRDSSEDGES